MKKFSLVLFFTGIFLTACKKKEEVTQLTFDKPSEQGWTVYTSKNNSYLPSGYIQDICTDNSGNIWIADYYDQFHGGLVFIDNTSWKWKIYTPENSPLPVTSVEALISDNSSMWIGMSSNTKSGVLKYTQGKWEVFSKYNSGLLDHDILEFARDSSGGLWIGHYIDKGFEKYQNSIWSSYTKDNSQFPDLAVNSMAADGRGNIWIGTERKGLVKFDGTNWTIYDTLNSPLPHNDITSVTVDASNNVWLATDRKLVLTNPATGGYTETGYVILKFDGTNWTTYSKDNSQLPPTKYLGPLLAEDNIIWIGTGDHGLVKFDGATWETFSTSNSPIPSDYVRVIHIDNKGRKWIGTSSGVATFK